jgi:nucleotide-binding universal stress UspA family protein
MTINQRPRPVVAGVDYSTFSPAVISCAAWEAARRGIGLRLVNCFDPAPSGGPPPGPPYDENEVLVAAEERFSEAMAGVRHQHPDLPIATKVVAGPVARTLVEESATATLVVVGALGSGGFPDLLLGSVAAQVSRHARCPAIVVRGPRRPQGRFPGSERVLVGVDDSERSSEALRFGFDEAAARGVPLIAAHVWSVPAVSARSFGTVWSQDPRRARVQLGQVGETVLTDALSSWPDKYPSVRVERLSVHGDEAARTLLEIAGETSAALIVVGSRERAGSSGPVLGSVSQAVVTHARTSVAVVHDADAGDTASARAAGRAEPGPG